MISVNKRKLYQIAGKKLKQAGFNHQEIQATLDAWNYATMSEKYSHGFDRYPWLLELVNQGKIIPNSPLKKTKNQLLTKFFGNKSLGYLAANNAVKEVIQLAKKFFIGITVIHDCYPTGCLGQYSEAIAKNNLVGFTIAKSPCRVNAYGTAEKIFGTVGHSFGFPGEKMPYLYDSSVGSITNGQIMLCHKLGKLLPKKSVLDQSGRFIQNPNQVIDKNGLFNGIISIAGGQDQHKFSGLAGSLELLLNLALIDTSRPRCQNCSVFFAFNPKLFGNVHYYKKLVSQLQTKITHAKKIKGVTKVYFAGQKSFLLRQKNLKKKTVQISDTTYAALFN